MTKNQLIDEFNKMEQEIVIPYLKKIFDTLGSACCLYHMIEQSEDIYTYLINGKSVITLEISRIDNSIINDGIIAVEEYAKMKKGKQYHHYLKELLELSKRSDFQV
ncbi:MULTISPECIES: hypothetical protein [unclassified Gilliamella]|uniref:hypothetical protein n=1 Tax=unclassified Gilliamella TaxID=2685620 RepID=UPI00226AAD8A|nr:MULTISPECIES: hypothetical protein [unclassified Gilliamella]MCX8600766.1 hypothetical protein [Gilliamella sp. B3722]MCX8607582.1 hypothetical protein [Gilliamella sp. B3771]MCX8609986.1 hypothetical protein [Gilliamella sp. B3891]MCX8611924.1 hypothetical protein [Gilliamella sp. B3773]MCX8614880.1 hypothetical protein [Gilliamella sp. B3770]